MIRFPNCKINLGLNVVARRPDGFHDIETVFHPVPLCDILEIVPSPDRQLHFTASGLPIPGDPEKNLVVKAFRLLNEEFGIPPVEIFLHKVILMGSGLGGGSSDGAFALSMLNDLFSLGLSQEQLIARAARLGSDCPFFLLNRPVWAAGKGELFGDDAPSLSGYWLALAVPGLHVSTAEAYAMITPAIPAESLSAIMKLSVKEWRGRLVNDFEEPVSEKFPVIGEIRESLYRAGALYAAMSGSGSAVYGIFDRKPDMERSGSGDPPQLNRPGQWHVQVMRIPGVLSPREESSIP